MSSDNAACFGDCPRPKKSKPSEEPSADWAHLPSTVLHEVFDLLDRTDRRSASRVCKSWRQYVFHPRWWPHTTFKIEPGHIEKAKFLVATFGKRVARATVKVNTLSTECTDEFIVLLELLSDNNNLKELIIEPTHCHFIKSDSCRNVDVVELLARCLPNLTKFSIGCVEDFSHSAAKYLSVLSGKQADRVTHLGLASVKDNPNSYEASYFDPELIRPFTKLQILSIDYDQLSDNFLSCLEDSKELERLVVHLHGIRDGHPGTSNSAWLDFKEKHPRCELRLTAIHAYDEIGSLHDTVLKGHMPLTHLKVFFCENINMSVLEFLPAYADTLRSVMWVDSLGKAKRSWSFTASTYDFNPDPLIMTSWLCKKLEELVIYGYKYFDENLIAIARLRGAKLKKLEIAEYDVLVPPTVKSSHTNFLEDIPLHLKRPWAPMKSQDLHPVICNPTAGDSDEYLLPMVLTDLH